MPRRLVNLVLLGLVVALVATGLLGWALPLQAAAPLYVAHRLLGLALVIVLGSKIAIAARSLERRVPRGDRSVAIGAGTAFLLATSLALGLAWTLGLVSFDTFAGYSALNIHVFLGLALGPLVVWHLRRRWEARPPLGRLVTRRSALRLLGVSAASVALLPVLDRAHERRLTGSKHAGSFNGNDMPVTTWTFDAVPAIDASTWRLRVGETSFTYDDLSRFETREVVAVLDCTGGWWSEQRWRGVRVREVLEAAGGHGPLAAVVSVTGHRWVFSVADLAEAILATHLGGEPLAPAHGYPLRLVAPGRRGFQWIKWVDRIELT